MHWRRIGSYALSNNKQEIVFISVCHNNTNVAELKNTLEPISLVSDLKVKLFLDSIIKGT